MMLKKTVEHSDSVSWRKGIDPGVFHTSPKHPVSCMKPGLVIHFIYDIKHTVFISTLFNSLNSFAL